MGRFLSSTEWKNAREVEGKAARYEGGGSSIDTEIHSLLPTIFPSTLPQAYSKHWRTSSSSLRSVDLLDSMNDSNLNPKMLYII
jgi:hypothetical protein